MDKILLGHGSGGRMMHQLIREHIAPALDIRDLGDSAIIDLDWKGCRLAFTTDSYVVSPLFFPGGNIGDLAVNGTVNDLAVVGATPRYLTAGFIIEEGFPLADLERILSSMAAAAKGAGVAVVAGDTKVVDKGKGDGIFINTAGVGTVPGDLCLGPRNIRPGDRVLISGSFGRHGIAVMAERNGLAFDPPVLSDCAALNGLVSVLLSSSGLRMMRDPTRGGVATTLKEMAVESGCVITVSEKLLPLSGGVRGACELLGLDPLYSANEGILIAVVSAGAAPMFLEKMRAHPLGKDAALIGEVSAGDERTSGMVLMKTGIGGMRIVDMLAGEQLPRIC